jgi:50S ribosomal protein uL3
MKKTLGIVGRKIGMTRIYGADGNVIPVTVIQAGPCPVIEKKVSEKDGYTALQVGFEEVAAHRLTKPEQGHQQKANCGFYRMLKEIRLGSVDEYEIGQKLTVEMFTPGEKIRVTGTSKGRGFAGVIRRWNFSAALPHRTDTSRFTESLAPSVSAPGRARFSKARKCRASLETRPPQCSILRLSTSARKTMSCLYAAKFQDPSRGSSSSAR